MADARRVTATVEPTEPAPPSTAPQGGVKGKRKSKKDKLREAAALAEAATKRQP